MKVAKPYLKILLVFGVTIGVGFSGNAQPDHSMAFTSVIDNLDLTKKTSLYVKQYWSEIKGRQVTWRGQIKGVKGGRGKAELRVANKARRTYKGFNIVLISHDVSGAAKFELGQQIRFTGVLHKYKSKKGNPIIVYLDQVEFQ